MKKIEDYLPHYLGCKMQYATHYEPQGATYELDEHNLAEAMKFGDLPLLRPLDTMEEEEAVELCKIETTSNRHHLIDVHQIKKTELHYTDGSRWQADGVDEMNDLYIQFNHLSPPQFAWLLSKGFDLFGLIDSNLALNSLTSNKENV